MADFHDAPTNAPPDDAPDDAPRDAPEAVRRGRSGPPVPQGTERRLRPSRWLAPPRWWLALELVVVFGAVPVVLWLERHRAAPLLLPLVFGGGLLALVLLLLDRSFPTRRLWHARAALADLRHLVLVRMLPAMLLVGVAYAIVEPDRLFGFPRNDPRGWLVVMLVYPALSVYPQELLFRALFFHRYAPVLGDGRTMILASGLLFGWAHLPFGTWIAPVLCALGGLLFAWTWHRTRSMAAVTFEHGLWGDFAFTIGLGWYFYTGSIAGT